MFSAPSLRDVDIILCHMTQMSIPHLTQFIDDIRGHYHTAQLVLEKNCFRYSLLAQEEYVDLPHVRSCLDRSRLSSSQDWIMQMSTTFSGKLSTIEELCVVTLDEVHKWDELIPLQEFFLKFPSIKVLRMQNVNNLRVARTSVDLKITEVLLIVFSWALWKKSSFAKAHSVLPRLNLHHSWRPSSLSSLHANKQVARSMFP